MKVTVNVTDEQLVAFYAKLPAGSKLSGLDGVKELTRHITKFLDGKLVERYHELYTYITPEQNVTAEHEVKQMFAEADEELERENLDN